jgi:hypothetical protein
MHLANDFRPALDDGLERRRRALTVMARRPTAGVERIERIKAENERLRAAIKAAEEAIHQHQSTGGSMDFDGVLARLRNALGKGPDEVG